MKNKQRSKEKTAQLTLLISFLYFAVTSISFIIVIWIRHFIYKSPVFSPNHVPPHISTYLFAILSIVIGTCLSVFVTKKILRPIQSVLEAMTSVAQGDYSVSVEPQGTTRFKSLGKRFNSMVEEIGSAEILKKDFINNFSHEFKTPITSILGFAKLLKSDELSSEEKTEYLDIIISESERLADLSQNILTLSGLENQSILSDTEEINISEQIRLCVALFDSRLAEKELDIEFDGEECIFSGNKSFLKQVWVNLTDNAIKFSPEGSKIKITVFNKDDETLITFSNHGEVLDETVRKRIFDKFYQADRSHKTSGNGLGLTLVKKIIQDHGGQIDVTSDDEFEIVFAISLPTEN